MFDLSPSMVWLILLVIFILTEVATVGLLTIWFAGGSLAALAQKKFNSGHIRTNAQTLIGEEAVVLEPIDNLQSQGRVMIHGQEWAARSVDEKEKFEKDAVVRVQSISGVKLMVTRSVGQ